MLHQPHILKSTKASSVSDLNNQIYISHSTSSSSPSLFQYIYTTLFAWGAYMKMKRRRLNPLKLLQQTLIADSRSRTPCDTDPWRHHPRSCIVNSNTYEVIHKHLINDIYICLVDGMIKKRGYHKGPRGGGTSSAINPLMHWATGPSPTRRTY